MKKRPKLVCWRDMIHLRSELGYGEVGARMHRITINGELAHKLCCVSIERGWLA